VAAPTRGPYFLQAGLLAGCRVLRRADLLHRVEAVLHDGVLDVALRDLDRRQQLRRNAARAVVHRATRSGVLLALEQIDRHLRSGLRLRLDRLVDGHRLLTHEEPLDAVQLGVLAGKRRERVEAGVLDRRRDARGHPVVRRVEPDDLALAERGDGLLSLGLGLVRRPVRGVVLLADRHLAVEHGVCALLELAGVRIGRSAVDHDDRTALRVAALLELIEERRALQLADSHVVERDVVVDRAARETVVRDDRHVLRLGLADDRLRGLAVDWIEHEHLRALGQHRLRLRLLLRRVLVRVRVEQLAVRAERLQLLLEIRVVEGLVAGRLRLRQQQADRAALRAAASAAAGTALLRGATSPDRYGQSEHRYRSDDQAPTAQ
jgi:hypothetical protein